MSERSHNNREYLFSFHVQRVVATIITAPAACVELSVQGTTVLAVAVQPAPANQV